MLFSDIALFDGNLDYQEHRYVGIHDGVIAYIGDKAPTEDYGEVYDGRRKLLMPGLVNAHSHVPMTLLRGYAENLPLDRWLNEMVFPFEAKITDESAYPATLLGIAEMLRFGTTSFSDMYFFSDARSAAVIESGIKCNLCHSFVEFTGAEYKDIPTYAINEHLLKDFQGAANGRLVIDFSLHAEYTTQPPVVKTLAEAAHDEGVRIHLHLSETKSEHEQCKERHGGLTPAAYFESLGVFENPTTAAHCVWLEGDDFDILARNGVTAAANPASNCKLGSGIANHKAMLDAGINLALGTDSVCSNNNLNMFKDMYLLALVQRGADHDPVGISPKQAIYAATQGGAKAQGRDDCGRIALGCKADLCVLDVDVPWMSPCVDMATNVVYSAQGSDVVLTMVDGAVLYRNGEYTTIDVEKVAAETQEWHNRIVSEL